MKAGGDRIVNQAPQAGPRPTPTSDFRPKPQQPRPNAAPNAPRFQPRPGAGPHPQEPEPKAKPKADGKAAKKKADR